MVLERFLDLPHYYDTKIELTTLLIGLPLGFSTTSRFSAFEPGGRAFNLVVNLLSVSFIVASLMVTAASLRDEISEDLLHLAVDSARSFISAGVLFAISLPFLENLSISVFLACLAFSYGIVLALAFAGGLKDVKN